MSIEDVNVDFSLPSAIKDFIFDLHDSMRRARRTEDVQKLYETRFKEITDKYFSQSAWPDAKLIASEANYDEPFLLFYRYICEV